MQKFIFLSLIFIYSPLLFSKNRYILTIFHGHGGVDPKRLTERKQVPQNFKEIGIEKVYDIGHSVSSKEQKKILENFNCINKVQQNSDLRLIIWGYSWGARNTFEFSKMYQENCGQKADFGYLVDGVQKPILKFNKAPISKVCKNYYKKINPIRGRSLDNCQNFDLTESCKKSDGSFMEGFLCHQIILIKGNKLIEQDIESLK